MAWRSTLLALAVLIAVALPAVAETHVVFDKVEVKDEVAHASIRIEGLLDRKAQERLASGKEFDTTVRFYLYRKRKHLPDAKLVVRSVQLTAIYNAVTQEYLINRTLRGKILSSVTVRSLDAFRKELETLTDVPLFELGPELSGERVFLRARAFLGLDYILGLVPSERWTDTVSSSPFRVQ